MIHSSTEDQEQDGNGEVSYRSWEKDKAYLEWPHGVVRVGSGRETRIQNLRVAWLGLPVRASWAHSHLKSGVWFGPRGSL